MQYSAIKNTWLIDINSKNNVWLIYEIFSWSVATYIHIKAILLHFLDPAIGFASRCIEKFKKFRKRQEKRSSCRMSADQEGPWYSGDGEFSVSRGKGSELMLNQGDYLILLKKYCL